jgi:DNA-binding response OmpR family regulator
VGVESEYGKGSTFYAILPKKIMMEENIFTSITSYSAKSKILVIEDDPQEAEFLFTTLTKEGYAVDIANTGEDALKMLGNKKYDAITLALLMPDMNGWQILKSLRSHGLNQDVAVIVITIVKEKEESFGFSISDFLVKPIKSQDLLDSINRLNIAPGHEKTVLVIDDDPQALKLAANILESNQVNVICETDSKRGLSLAKKIKPSAIILNF